MKSENPRLTKGKDTLVPSVPKNL